MDCPNGESNLKISLLSYYHSAFENKTITLVDDLCSWKTICIKCNHARDLGAIHTGELDRSEIDLSPKRSECERSNAN